MAFKPGGPGFSSNTGAGGAPPPMMMFNPAQFSQPQAPQVPLPPSTPATQTQQINTSISNSNQQGVTSSQPFGGQGAFSSQQQFHPTPDQYQQQTSPDSTSNPYQNAGMYHEYSSAPQAQQQPQYEGSNWNYGNEGMHNTQQYHPQQSAEQYPNSTPNSYQQSQQPSYDSYSSHSGATENVTPNQATYQNQAPPFAQPTSNTFGVHEGLEGGHMPYVQESNSFYGHVQPPVSTNHMNSTIAQPTTSTALNSSREPSVPHSGTEPANKSDSGTFQPNSFDQSNYAHQPQAMPLNNQPINSFSIHGQETTTSPEAAGNSTHPPPMWSSNDNIDYKQPASTFEKFPESNVGTGNTQAQPDIVSATSSTTSPSTSQQLPPASYEGVTLNSPISDVQSSTGNPSAERYEQIDRAPQSIPEIQGKGQLVANSTSWEQQELPNSLPPLFNPYQGQSNPPTAMMSKGGYGLGPDVVTAVSSTSHPNPLLVQSQGNPMGARDDVQAVKSNAQELGEAEEPLWESNVIAEETNQATAKMASRIDEMRKAQAGAVQSQLPPENIANNAMNNLPPCSNVSQQASETSNIYSNVQNYTDSSLDTSPEHKGLQTQQGSVALGSHAEHYAYYQQFENLSADRDGLSNEANASAGTVYNRTPDVIAAQQSVQHPGAPPSSDRNLYMQTGHLNEQDDILNHEGQSYQGELARTSESSSSQKIFGQPSILRPTTVPDGGNEMPVVTSGATRPESSERQEAHSVPDVDIPLDRLVLGESESGPNQQMPAMPQAPYSMQPSGPDPPSSNWNVWNSEQTNRVVTGEDDRRIPGAASNTDTSSLSTMQQHLVPQLQQPSSLPPVSIYIHKNDSLYFLHILQTQIVCLIRS